MNEPVIFNIQKFSIHDGPGIRTTVFFKGCPMRCLWCHNPESQSYEIEFMQDRLKGRENVGIRYSIPDLVKILKKDQIFYDQSGGGVTLSGGEVMTQDMDYVTDLLKNLEYLGINVAIDTAGYAPLENFRRVIPYTERFLYDLKFISADKHLKYTGVSNDLVLENLKYLGGAGAKIDLRLILVENVNTDEESIMGIHEFLAKEHIRIEQISLLPYHDFGKDKYAKLGRPCTQVFKKPDSETVEKIYGGFAEKGYSVKIGG